MSDSPQPSSNSENSVTTTGREDEYEEEEDDEEEGEIRECDGDEDEVVVDDFVKSQTMEAEGGVTTSTDARPSEAGECVWEEGKGEEHYKN